MNEPIVSVVMGVYNGRRALRETIRSILTQTLREFEFVIVNDGSTDGSQQILEDYAASDPRIKLINQENRGLTVALKRGCAESRGKYIARQDVGDLSKPHRLEKQALFLDANPDVVVCCPFLELFGPGNEPLGLVEFPIDSAEATLCWHQSRTAPYHSATMFRREAYFLAGGYREEFRLAQDHDLWYRLTEFGKIGYVPDPLFCWILDEDGISATSAFLQKKFAEIASLCHRAKIRGDSEDALLACARKLSIEGGRQIKKAGCTDLVSYYVGSRLLSRGDRRCLNYFLRTLNADPLNWRAWAKLVWGFATCRLGNQVAPRGAN